MSFSMVNFCGINAIRSASQLICALSIKGSFPILLNLDLLTFLEQCKTNHCCFVNGCTLLDWDLYENFSHFTSTQFMLSNNDDTSNLFYTPNYIDNTFAFALLDCSLYKYRIRNIWNCNISYLFIECLHHFITYCKLQYQR